MNKNISSVLEALVVSSFLTGCSPAGKEELPIQSLLTKELIASVQDGTAEIVCQKFITRDALAPDPIVMKGSDIYRLEYPNTWNDLKTIKAQKLPEMTLMAQNSKDPLLVKRLIRKSECKLDF